MVTSQVVSCTWRSGGGGSLWVVLKQKPGAHRERVPELHRGLATAQSTENFCIHFKVSLSLGGSHRTLSIIDR